MGSSPPVFWLARVTWRWQSNSYQYAVEQLFPLWEAPQQYQIKITFYWKARIFPGSDSALATQKGDSVSHEGFDNLVEVLKSFLYQYHLWFFSVWLQWGSGVQSFLPSPLFWSYFLFSEKKVRLRVVLPKQSAELMLVPGFPSIFIVWFWAKWWSLPGLSFFIRETGKIGPAHFIITHHVDAQVVHEWEQKVFQEK